MTSKATDLTALPADRSFVVQLSGDSRPDGPWRGRAEHIVSGRRTHFASLDELRAFVARALAQLDDRPPPHDGGSEEERP